MIKNAIVTKCKMKSRERWRRERKQKVCLRAHVLAHCYSWPTFSTMKTYPYPRTFVSGVKRSTPNHANNRDRDASPMSPSLVQEK